MSRKYSLYTEILVHMCRAHQRYSALWRYEPLVNIAYKSSYITKGAGECFVGIYANNDFML